MYDRIVGSGPNSSDMIGGTMAGGGMGNRQNSYQMQEEQQSMGNGTLIFNPTINQQIRNRHIVRDAFGQPLGKIYKKNFVPANRAQAKTEIKNDNFTMCENEFNITHQAEIEHHIN